MIKVSGLGKSFGARHVLSDVSFEVARGECLGITGQNGSGRTTLVRIVAALVRPSSGQITIGGVDAVADPYRARAHAGYVGGEPPAAPDGMRVDEYLEVVAATRGGGRLADDAVRQALGRAALGGTSLVATLSDSERQRLMLAAALLPSPGVLLLDDPLRSLDKGWRDRALGWLRDARTRGAAVLYASADVADLEASCDRILRLDAGRVADIRRPALRALQANG